MQMGSSPSAGPSFGRVPRAIGKTKWSEYSNFVDEHKEIPPPPLATPHFLFFFIFWGKCEYATYCTILGEGAHIWAFSAYFGAMLQCLTYQSCQFRRRLCGRGMHVEALLARAAYWTVLVHGLRCATYHRTTIQYPARSHETVTCTLD